MLPFFRKIRYRLAKDNQFFTYSRYALGEIVLVVIGILIALYINNWNEKRKTAIVINQSLTDLLKEIVSNEELLSSIQINNANSIKSIDILLKNTYPNSKGEIESIDILISRATYVPKFNPIDNAYRSIISSGIIHSIEDTELKYLLTSYDRSLEEYNYWMDLNTSFVMDQLYPILYKNYNIANLITNFEFMPPNRSNFEFEPKSLLSSKEFENLLSERRLFVMIMKLQYKKLDSIQQEMKTILKMKEKNR